ncbi:MAG TPA: asparaginase [Candidatus Baltobacteraceae bacterium]|jgi:L-asparaginase II|nr:asparaginase [Candidatus Baltobacteraceae bacterium]
MLNLRPQGVPLVDVLRGELVESVHNVAVCASDPHGRSLFELGDVDIPVYLRSSAKPFIAAAIVSAGVVEVFGLDAREIAVISATHSGESEHIDAVRSILQKAGIAESALACGADQPGNAAVARRLVERGEPAGVLYNNCSGKHAGILALSKLLGVDPAGYLDRHHPAQVHILAFCARVMGVAIESLHLGIDGCGIPVIAVSLRRAARAFARFATLEDVTETDAQALLTVRQAVVAEPFYLAGSGCFDTALIEATRGRVVGKGGVEGTHASALIERGCGLVLKVIDGNKRATPPVVIAFLKTLQALDPEAERFLAEFAEPLVRNVAGRIVGRVQVSLPYLERSREVAS